MVENVTILILQVVFNEIDALILQLNQNVAQIVIWFTHFVLQIVSIRTKVSYQKNEIGESASI